MLMSDRPKAEELTSKQYRWPPTQSLRYQLFPSLVRQGTNRYDDSICTTIWAPEQAQEQGPERTPEQGPEQTLEQGPEWDPERPPEQGPEWKN